jgi:hypothetical protein
VGEERRRLQRQATQYLGFINEARKSTGSGAMARTSINAVQDAILKKEGKLNKFGIKTRNEDGSERNFIDIVEDTIVKTGGKGEFFNKVFDPSRSGKAIATMVTAFQSAEIQKKGTGRAAMETLLAGDESLKSANVNEMQKDAALRMEDAGTRIRKSVETIRQSIGEQLAPILEKLAANAPVIAEKFGSLLKWVVENPGKAGAGFVAASAFKGAAPSLGKAALRFAGDSIANMFPGFGGRALGQAMASSGATPVYVTGAAPGVLGGGGGLAGASGAALLVLAALRASSCPRSSPQSSPTWRPTSSRAHGVEPPKPSGDNGPRPRPARDGSHRRLPARRRQQDHERARQRRQGSPRARASRRHAREGQSDPTSSGSSRRKAATRPSARQAWAKRGARSPTGSSRRSSDRRSREDARALDSADTPLGKIVAQNDPPRATVSVS